MRNRRRVRSRDRRVRRRGTILIVIVVLLLVAASIAGAVMRGMLLDARQLTTDRQAMQADRLAEAGLARAMVRLQAEPGYTGEEWSAELAEGDRGAVVITVTEAEGARTIEAAAEFGTGGQRARGRRTAVLAASGGSDGE